MTTDTNAQCIQAWGGRMTESSVRSPKWNDPCPVTSTVGSCRDLGENDRDLLLQFVTLNLD